MSGKSAQDCELYVSAPPLCTLVSCLSPFASSFHRRLRLVFTVHLSGPTGESVMSGNHICLLCRRRSRVLGLPRRSHPQPGDTKRQRG